MQQRPKIERRRTRHAQEQNCSKIAPNVPSKQNMHEIRNDGRTTVPPQIAKENNKSLDKITLGCKKIQWNCSECCRHVDCTEWQKKDKVQQDHANLVKINWLNQPRHPTTIKPLIHNFMWRAKQLIPTHQNNGDGNNNNSNNNIARQQTQRQTTAP